MLTASSQIHHSWLNCQRNGRERPSHCPATRHKGHVVSAAAQAVLVWWPYVSTFVIKSMWWKTISCLQLCSFVWWQNNLEWLLKNMNNLFHQLGFCSVQQKAADTEKTSIGYVNTAVKSERNLIVLLTCDSYLLFFWLFWHFHIRFSPQMWFYIRDIFDLSGSVRGLCGQVALNAMLRHSSEPASSNEGW